MNDLLKAYAKLFSSAEGVPCKGIYTPRVRVELNENDCNWIAELISSDDMPWKLDCFQEVELRIMSEEFKIDVKFRKPDLDITRGGELIGKLTFKYCKD